MANIKINKNVIEGVEAIILDKDGTIMDFDKMWKAIIAERAKVIAEKVNEEHPMCETAERQLQSQLVYAMGIDPLSGKVEPRGPVAIATRVEVMTCAISCLYNNGIPWDVAKKTVDWAFTHVDQVINLRSLVYPVSGMRETFEAWDKAGIRILLASTDNTAKIELAIEELKLEKLVAGYIGGDKVAKSKPEPDMILSLTSKLGLDPAKCVMVGDAVTDVMMGKNAGCLASVGVLTGVTSAAALMEQTEYVTNSIADIEVA